MKALTFAAVAVACLLGCAQPPAGPGPGPLSSEKAITSFCFAEPAAPGTIDEGGKAIGIEVPAGTDLSALVGFFDTTGTRVTVGGVEQASGETVNDFTAAVDYVVSAEDGSEATYRVTVVRMPSTGKEITSFSIQEPPAVGAIDEEARIVRVRLPPGASLQSLVAEFTTTGASVAVGGVEQESGVTPNDFTLPVDYVVTAEDGSIATWNVRVVSAIGLLVNELDVDQVGTDAAEYVEIRATSDVDLAGIVLVMFNGAASPGQEYGRVELSPAGELLKGEYLLVAGPQVTAAAGALKYSPPGWESSNRIQNGPSDAVMLYDTIGSRVIDTVSYGGVLRSALLAGGGPEVDATEGVAAAPADSNSLIGSIARVPDACDTGQNGADFRFSPSLTPGAPNG